ncbi:NECTIN3 isoform 1, partial [Pan troglodytes]
PEHLPLQTQFKEREVGNLQHSTYYNPGTKTH